MVYGIVGVRIVVGVLMDFNFVSPIALLHMRDESYRFSVMQKLHLLEQQLLKSELKKGDTLLI